MVIEPTSATKREVVYFTSVGVSSVTTADDTTDASDTLGRGCLGSITQGAVTAHDQGVTVIIASVEQYWKRLHTAFTAEHSTAGAHTAVTATSVDIGSTIPVTGVLDEDTMSSNSAVKLATQQSIKAYVDTPRILSAASYTTDTGTSLNVDTQDEFIVTAQAGALLFNAPSGTPKNGQKFIIRIKDDATARALTWNAIFRAIGTALPSTTVLSKTKYLGFIYNSTDTKWDLVASADEA